MLKSITETIVEPYNPSLTYSSGDYASWDNMILRCKATTENEQTPPASKWDVVTRSVLAEMASRIAGLSHDTDESIQGIRDSIVVGTGDALATFFSRGGINSEGILVGMTYRIATPSTITFPHDMTVYTDEGFIVTAWFYPQGQTAYRKVGCGLLIESNIPVRLLVNRSVEDTSEVADIVEFATAVHLTEYDKRSTVINALAAGIEPRRYEHIEYLDMLENEPSIDKRTSPQAGIDYLVHIPSGRFSIKFLTNATATSTEIRFTLPTSFTLDGVQEFDMVLYTQATAQVTRVSLRTFTGGFVKTVTQSLGEGWHHIRFASEGAGTLDYTADIVTLRVIVTHPEGSNGSIWIGGLERVKPEYGNIIIIDDGPYYSFYTNAYPTLANMGVPVSWAVDGEMLDDANTTPRKLINENELELLAFDGISEFSFHSYDGTIMSNATSAEALSDTLNSIRYLRQHGLEPQRIWRAAWLQNSCANPELANLELDGSCSPTGAAGTTLYPFEDRHNIPRISLHGRDTEYMDVLFDKLRYKRITVFVYTHGIADNSDKDLSTTMLAYFISKLQEGITGGWLNPTTYNRLISYYKEI